MKAGPTTNTFDYDGQNVLRERNGTTVQKTWIHGPGIEEPLASDASGTFTYSHADGLGSILATRNASGTVTATWSYDAFGGSAAAARYYDPRIGRFISEDPLGFRADANFYAYVGNRPTTLIDPMGLFCDDPGNGSWSTRTSSACWCWYQFWHWTKGGTPPPIEPLVSATELAGPGTQAGLQILCRNRQLQWQACQNNPDYRTAYPDRCALTDNTPEPVCKDPNASPAPAPPNPEPTR